MKKITFIIMTVFLLELSASGNEYMQEISKKFPFEKAFNILSDSEQPFVNRNAAQDLCIYGGAKHLDFVKNKVASGNRLEKQLAVRILGECAPAEYEPEMVALLSNENFVIQRLAGRILTTFYSRQGALFISPRLVALATDTHTDAFQNLDDEKKEILLESLLFARGKINTKLSAEEESCGLNLLSKDSTTIRKAAIACLERGSEKSLPALLNLLDSEDESISFLATAVLTERGHAEGLKKISRLLASENSPIKMQTLQLVKELGNPLFETNAAGLLADSSWHIRKLSCEALGKMKMRAITPGLHALLSDKDARVKVAAAVALRSQGAMGMERRLLMWLEDNDTLLRTEAAKALGEIGYAEAKEELKKLAEDESDEISVAAIKALESIIPDQNELSETLLPATRSERLPLAVAAAKILDSKIAP